MAQLFGNNSSSTLDQAVADGTDLTFVIPPADASKFPVVNVGDLKEFMVVTIQDALGNYEICRINGHAGNGIFLVDDFGRGYEDTNPSGWAIGTRIEIRATAGTQAHMFQIDDDRKALGTLDMDDEVLTGLPIPVDDSGAARKDQIDFLATGLGAVSEALDRMRVAFTVSSGTKPNWFATFVSDTTLEDGQRCIVKAHDGMDEAEDMTLNVNGYGARDIKAAGGQVLSNYSIEQNQFMDLVYSTASGGYWELMNPLVPVETTENIILERIYPVGAIYLTLDSTNPGDWLPGDWGNVGKGRFLVGIGGTSGANGVSRTYNAENDSVGNYTQSLSNANLPNNLADGMAIYLDAGGQSDSHNETDRVTRGRAGTKSAVTTPLLENSNTFQGTKHENSPPAYGVYIWHRTA